MESSTDRPASASASTSAQPQSAPDSSNAPDASDAPRADTLPVAGTLDTGVPGTLPDRLSTDPRSPYHVRALIERGVGIRFNGTERFDISEYCISEGWIKVAVGKSVDRRGQPLTIKLKGRVEAFLR